MYKEQYRKLRKTIVKIEGFYQPYSKEVDEAEERIDEEQFNQVFAVKIMTEGYVLVQSLTPKWAGKKLNFSFWDLLNLSKVAKVLAPELAKQKPMFSEMGENCWEFPKWVKYVNEETIGLKAECSSINIQANAKGNY